MIIYLILFVNFLLVKIEAEAWNQKITFRPGGLLDSRWWRRTCIFEIKRQEDADSEQKDINVVCVSSFFTVGEEYADKHCEGQHNPMENMTGEMKAIFQHEGDGTTPHAGQHEDRYERHFQVNRDEQEQDRVGKRVEHGRENSHECAIL